MRGEGGRAVERTDLPVGRVGKHGLIPNAPMNLAELQDLTGFLEKVVLAESDMELPPRPPPKSKQDFSNNPFAPQAHRIQPTQIVQ